MSDQLQEGIYFRSGETPGPVWRLLLLNIVDNVTSSEAGAAIAVLWEMLQRLKLGLISDLNPTTPKPDDPASVAVSSGDLTCLIGYGARLFDQQAHPLPVVRMGIPRPPTLRNLLASGVNQPFRRLHWTSQVDRRQSRADIGLQFIASTELAVNRAIVETQKIIADKNLPLQIVDFFSVFGRDDRRSWIDFHDGINTMSATDRLKVIELIDDTDTAWMVGGTFMAFLRIEVNLQLWRDLSREKQELIVGRDKLTGCPLTSTQRNDQGILSGVKMAGCPISGDIPSPAPASFLDPPRPSGDQVLQASHIHRANLNRRADPRELASNRIFRQGYEFLESRHDGRLSLGLNFVSFQSNVLRVSDILSRNNWMGDANFGGISNEEQTGDAPDIPLLSLIAGCYLAVPPKSQPFPGADLFA